MKVYLDMGKFRASDETVWHCFLRLANRFPATTFRYFTLTMLARLVTKRKDMEIEEKKKKDGKRDREKLKLASTKIREGMFAVLRNQKDKNKRMKTKTKLNELKKMSALRCWCHGSYGNDLF